MAKPKLTAVATSAAPITTLGFARKRRHPTANRKVNAAWPAKKGERKTKKKIVAKKESKQTPPFAKRLLATATTTPRKAAAKNNAITMTGIFLPLVSDVIE